MIVTPFDTRSFLRCLAVSLAVTAVAAAVMVATDGALGSGVRIARLGLLAPAIGATASVVVGMQARLHGDERALLSLGVPPARIHAGAFTASIVVGLCGALALALPVAELEGLFPRLGEVAWHMEPSGAFYAPELGVIVGPGPAEVSFGAAQATSRPLPPREAVVASTVVAALAVSLWLQFPRSHALRILVGSTTVVTGLVLFHLVASTRASAWWLMLLSAPMMVDALLAWRKLGTGNRNEAQE